MAKQGGEDEYAKKLKSLSQKLKGGQINRDQYDLEMKRMAKAEGDYRYQNQDLSGSSVGASNTPITDGSDSQMTKIPTLHPQANLQPSQGAPQQQLGSQPQIPFQGSGQPQMGSGLNPMGNQMAQQPQSFLPEEVKGKPQSEVDMFLQGADPSRFKDPTGGFAPTGMLGAQTLYPGQSDPILKGYTSGQVIGSQPIFTPSGMVMPYDIALAKEKAKFDRMSTKQAAREAFKVPEAPELMNKKYSREFSDNFYDGVKKIMDESKETYDKDWAEAIMSDEPVGMKLRKFIEYNRDLAKMENQLYENATQAVKESESGERIYSPELMSRYNDYFNRMETLDNSSVEDLEELYGMSHEIQAAESLDQYLNDNNIVGKIKYQTEEDWKRTGANDDYDTYKSYKLSTIKNQAKELSESIKRSGYSNTELVTEDMIERHLLSMLPDQQESDMKTESKDNYRAKLRVARGKQKIKDRDEAMVQSQKVRRANPDGTVSEETQDVVTYNPTQKHITLTNARVLGKGSGNIPESTKKEYWERLKNGDKGVIEEWNNLTKTESFQGTQDFDQFIPTENYQKTMDDGSKVWVTKGSVPQYNAEGDLESYEFVEVAYDQNAGQLGSMFTEQAKVTEAIKRESGIKEGEDGIILEKDTPKDLPTRKKNAQSEEKNTTKPGGKVKGEVIDYSEL